LPRAQKIKHSQAHAIEHRCDQAMPRERRSFGICSGRKRENFEFEMSEFALSFDDAQWTRDVRIGTLFHNRAIQANAGKRYSGGDISVLGIMHGCFPRAAREEDNALASRVLAEKRLRGGPKPRFGSL
jgi:hypothetical protein